MNQATRMILEIAVDQFSCMSWDNTPVNTGYDMEDYFLRQLEDNDECYDEEWYALVGTPAIRATIDWKAIAEAVNEEVCDRYAIEVDTEQLIGFVDGENLWLEGGVVAFDQEEIVQRKEVNGKMFVLLNDSSQWVRV